MHTAIFLITFSAVLPDPPRIFCRHIASIQTFTFRTDINVSIKYFFIFNNSVSFQQIIPLSVKGIFLGRRQFAFDPPGTDIVLLAAGAPEVTEITVEFHRIGSTPLLNPTNS
jgi:hypothetical protein